MKIVKQIIAVLMTVAFAAMVLTSCVSGGKGQQDQQKTESAEITGPQVETGMAILSGHTAFTPGYNTIAYGPDGKMVATAGNDRTVKVWNVENERLLHTFQLARSAQWISWSPNGRYIAATYNVNTGAQSIGVANVLDTYSGGAETGIIFRGGGRAVFSENSSLVVAAGNYVASIRGFIIVEPKGLGKTPEKKYSKNRQITNIAVVNGLNDLYAVTSGYVDVRGTIINEGIFLYSPNSGVRGKPIQVPFGTDCLLTASPDGKMIAAAAKFRNWGNIDPNTPDGLLSQTVYVYNVDKRTELGNYRISVGIVRDIRFRQDNSHPEGALQLLVDTTNANTVIFDLASGEIIDTIDNYYLERQFAMAPEPLSSIAWSNDGRRLAVTKYNNVLKENRVSIWDMESASLINTFPTTLQTEAEEEALSKSDNRAASAVFSPDGTDITVGMYPGYYRTYNAATGRLVSNFENNSGIYDAYLTANRNAESRREVPPLPPTVQAAYSPDNRSLLLLNGVNKQTKVKRSFRVIDAMPGIKAGEYEWDHTVWPFMSGITIVDKVTGNKTAELVNYDEQEKLSGDETEQFRNAIYSRDGKMIAAAGFRNLRIWDAANGNVLRTFKISEGYQLQPSDNRNQPGTVIIPKAAGNTLAFSQDGSLLAMGGHGVIIVFDIKANRELKKFEFYADFNYPIAAIAVTPDNKLVMAINEQGSLRVWDIETGQETQRMITNEMGALSPRNTAFSPDASRLAFITTTYSVEVWDIASEERAFLAVYTPEQWAAVAKNGSSWNSTEQGRRYIGYINEKGIPEPITQPTGDPELLLSVLTGKTGAEFKSAVTGPLENGTYTVRLPNGKPIRIAINDLETLRDRSYSLEHIAVSGQQFRVNISTNYAVTMQFISDNLSRVSLTNLDTGKSYTPSRSSPQGNSSYLDFSGVEGRRFNLSLPTPMSIPCVFYDFFLRYPD